MGKDMIGPIERAASHRRLKTFRPPGDVILQHFCCIPSTRSHVGGFRSQALARNVR